MSAPRAAQESNHEREPTTNHEPHESGTRERCWAIAAHEREREPRASESEHESREPRAENERHERTSESAKTAVLDVFQNISFGAKPASSRAKTPVRKTIWCFGIASSQNV